MQLPTVGRVVHFYSLVPDHQHNGGGAGPYVALVTQRFESSSDQTMVNLVVFPWSRVDHHGSVSFKDVAQAKGQTSWWEWPPTAPSLEVKNYIVGPNPDNR